MSTIADRIASIQRDHAAARTAVGVTGRTKVTAIKSGPSRAAADILTSRERALNVKRLTERARHAESTRLLRRLTAVRQAADECREGNPERAARLDLLAGDVESARERYDNTTWGVQAEETDWRRGGRFYAYARRYDLGFIGADCEDIMQEGAELLAITHAAAIESGARVLPQGELTATGSRTLPHTIGDGYRAIRHAYRRGLGFYGYERRGKVVERDASEHGYRAVESFTVQTLTWRGEDESARRAELYRSIVENGFGAGLADSRTAIEWDDGSGEISHADWTLVQRRRAALDTLTRRFPLNADGRMLALATLITEGYTLTEISEGLGVGGSTLTRWADELSTIS